MTADLLIASNRGPLSFRLSDEGLLRAVRGGGGLVSGLSALDAASGVTWVCSALSHADRHAAREAPGGFLDRAGHDTGGVSVRMLPIEVDVFERAYNSVANRTLWFIHHMLFATPVSPVFDRSTEREWTAFERYNAEFADALAAEAAPGARVLIQDYHLTLAPALLRRRRPDLSIAHFSHTPWAPPEYFRLLPRSTAEQVCRGILGADTAGFLARRWADAFARCCADVLGAAVREHGDTVQVELDGRVCSLRVHPLGVDGPGLRERAAAPDVEARIAALREVLAGRRLVLRIDRTELSKNIVRGIEAYGELLESYPQWRGKVVHLAFAYPSRHDLPEYREYTAAVQRAATAVNDRFGTADWQPLHLEVSDDYPRSLAAMRLADVLVVNPIRDGMNLVAKEGPVLSDDGVALVLSSEAGAADELAPAAHVVHPFSVTETAAAMHAALSESPATRSERCAVLAAAAQALPPSGWLAEQVAALRDHEGSRPGPDAP